MTKAVKTIKILGYHNLPLFTYVYDKVENPRGVIIIVHGMEEHAGRYKNFAKFLNSKGFIVLANDLRGHGHTAPCKALFGFGERNIFVESVIDEICIIKYAKKAYQLPVYLFGHSYGSMLSQSIIQHTNIVEKAVLCGTTDGNSLPMQVGAFLTKIIYPFQNKEKVCKVVENFSLKAYGRKFDKGNWFTKDEKIYDAYMKDELRGEHFPFSFYYSLSQNMSKMNKHINKIGNKKVFLIAGTDDPVGSYGKYVKTLYKRYLKNGINVKLKLYKGDRHELINETDKKQVYADVVDFYEK